MQLHRIISSTVFVVALLPAISAESADSARGMEFDVYMRLQEGMSEGELLTRAGPPDFQTVATASQDGFSKLYVYLPTAANPFTTTVTVSGGTIADVKRERKF
ncbi:MAG: hypothetical protein ABI771_16580 [Betaproteobacteria bacterium]